MTVFHLLRVFCGERGAGGNPLAVFLDGADVAPPHRQGIAAQLGLSETVFVDSAERGEIRIFTPEVELPFAGHPTVGTAWLLSRERAPVPVLRPPAGEVAVRYEDDLTIVRARPEWAPPYAYRQLDSPAAVDELGGPPPGADLPAVWAWIDEDRGVVRSRVFPVGIGIREDEATGAAAVQLCATLDRPIEIRQGQGSVLVARPAGDGWIELGGRCAYDRAGEL